jgi:hypothetical protein
MWIHFKSQRPYAIKVFAGDINAISGEPKNETSTSNIRRKKQLAADKSIQDYVVSPSHEWLDDITCLDGKSK